MNYKKTVKAGFVAVAIFLLLQIILALTPASLMVALIIPSHISPYVFPVQMFLGISAFNFLALIVSTLLCFFFGILMHFLISKFKT